MLWSCFAASDTRTLLHKVDGLMKEVDHCQIIKPKLSQKLVDGYQKDLAEVQLAKGHLTKY